MEEAEAPRLSSRAAETVPEEEDVAKEAGVANENAAAPAGALETVTVADEEGVAVEDAELETAEELVHVGVLSPG